MRYKLITILLILVMVLSACQPNPEEKIVVQKGDGRLEGIVASTPEITEQAIDAGEWVETYNIPRLKCEIKPEIVLPETKVFPVYKMRKGNFDPNIVGNVIQYLTADATGVRKTSLTKEEIEQQLIQVKRGTYVSDENGSRWEPYEGQQEEIKWLEEKLQNVAPEVFENITDNAIELPVDNTYAMKDGSRVYVKADTQNINISTDKNGVIQPESWIIDGEGIPGEPPGTTIETKISEEQVLEEVKTLISVLNIQNLGIAQTEKARIVNNYTCEITSQGWQVTLTRNDGDSIPVYLDPSQFTGVIDIGSEDYSARWWPEMLTVYVDETGIKNFSWTNPLEIVEKLNENVPILSFEDIKERIKEYIKVGYAKMVDEGLISGEGDLGLKVYKIVLTNILVPINNDLKYRMLAPAWLVYYKHIASFEGKSVESPAAVFAVNAIDGSSIALSVSRPERK